MKYLFYLAHPAHFYLFKNTILKLTNDGHSVKVVIQKKDILEQLLINSKIEYINILPKGRKDSTTSLVYSVLKKDFELLRISLSVKPDLLISSGPEITHVGKILNIPSILFFEDDLDQVKLYSKIGVPYATVISTPLSCNVGKWKSKNIPYDSYHELAYLHPKYFIPDINAISNDIDIYKPYSLIRLSSLNAYHDNGHTGINEMMTRELIDYLCTKGTVYISSERKLSETFDPFQIKIDPLKIHHVMHYAQIYIGDSQTMAAEAAVLGTPSVRFNDFVGKLGYLEELEKKYKLTFGISTSEPGKLLVKIKEILSIPEVKNEWFLRRERMLSEKIDLTSFIYWFITNYPLSTRIMKKDHDYYLNFK